MRGVELLADYRIGEGIPLCVKLCDPARWGASKRIEPCMKALASRGAAAKSQLTELGKLEADLPTPKASAAGQLQNVRHAIAIIESATDAKPVKSLDELARPARQTD